MRIKIDSLDKLFSQYIRMRAMSRVHGCERCGAWKADYKQLQCSHFEKRRKQSTRFDEMNCNGFCFGCHQYFEENYEEYKAWLIAQIGELEFDLLLGRMRQIGKPDKELLRLYYTHKIMTEV